jgi:hypothetical protein
MKTHLIFITTFIIGIFASNGYAEIIPGANSTGLGDEFACSTTFWGEISSGDDPITPSHSTRMPSEAGKTLMHGVGYAFSNFSTLGSIRFAPPPPPAPSKGHDDSFQETDGFATSQTTLTDETQAISEVSYRILYKTDKNGNATVAYQTVCLEGLLLKNNTVVADSGCPLVGEEPTAPNSGWQMATITNGVPMLSMNASAYAETTSQSGILKVSCNNNGIPIYGKPRSK